MILPSFGKSHHLLLHLSYMNPILGALERQMYGPVTVSGKFIRSRILKTLRLVLVHFLPPLFILGFTHARRRTLPRKT